MKIIILGTAYPYRGGLAAYNERLACEYKKLGHDVTIYTFSLQYPSFLFPGKTQYSSEAPPAGLDIRRLVNSVNPFNWLKLGWRLRKEAPDLILVRFWLPFMAPCLGTIVRLAQGNKKTRIVSILDNVIPHEKRPGDSCLIRYFMGSAEAFVAMSQSVLDDAEVFDRSKPKVLTPHPIYDHYGAKMPREEALGHLKLDSGYRYMLFFGFIRDYKGLDLLLKAFAEKGLHQNKVKLIVAGEFYNNSEYYFRLEQELGLQTSVIWHPDFIPDSEVKYFFNAADIIVQPYKTATQSGVTQIAYHFEKPMLVTDVGGLSEIVPHGKVGYSVPPDVEHIADALTDFFFHRKPEEFAAGIVEEKKKYQWETLIEKITGLLKQLP